MSNTTVTIDPETAKILDRLSKANGVTKKEFMKEALLYFEKYGINPVAHESPAQEMQKLIKRLDQVVGFIRTQEKDLIRPMFQAVVSSEDQIKTNLGNLPTKDNIKSYLTQLHTQVDNAVYKRVNPLSDDLKRLTSAQADGFNYVGSLIDAKRKTPILGDLNETYNRLKKK